MAIMNAGIASVTYAVTRDGWERGIQVNVLSTALLSLELLPLLLRTKERDSSSQPHLTIVTSDIHKSIKFPERNEQNILSALNDEKQWRESQAVGGATERYGVTKLMNLFITFEIAQLVPRDKSGNPLVIVNAVAPGFCKSDLLSREKVPLILKLIQALIARTAEEGSKTLLHAASQGAETHGKWLDNQIITEPGNIITSPEAVVLRKKLWAEILSVLHDVNPEIQTEY
ncbi:dehydrogenase short chain [Aspergillus fumigatus]|nr:dehydrogenase short chain [Aspergillus fumigatus]